MTTPRHARADRLVSAHTCRQSPPLPRGLQASRKKRSMAGVSAIEFALVLPMLLLLAIPIFDIARLIQAHIILVNISREGANLASRTSDTPQTIMNGISATAPPLNVGATGMIYITKVMGNREGSTVRNVVVQQDKWLGGGNTASSAIWGGCSNWSSGKCNSVPSNPNNAPTAPVMPGQLIDGEVVYVVEVFYRTQFLFPSIPLGFGLSTPQLSPDLYARTIF